MGLGGLVMGMVVFQVLLGGEMGMNLDMRAGMGIRMGTGHGEWARFGSWMRRRCDGYTYLMLGAMTCV